ncbi:interleukin-5 receptor subunit alpha [Pontoporia blainvillei]|uniref:Interleukin-5 receptor subunit alpha n=1 Tax=Pontoporia blainvillei TaxID=48723 RepID=A0ABX0S3R5_PONBL|nr:interleukin-5 receptor subunit alpha [Pontoporia blainvillei]
MLVLSNDIVKYSDFNKIPVDVIVLLLPPVNFTIKAINLAQVLLHWEPNTDQEQRNVQLGYHVKINAPQEEDYETRNTESRRVTILHKGFSASVQTVPWNDRSLQPSSWVSAELRAPPGSPGTSIVNLTCTTNTKANNYTHLPPYQVSLHCTWLVGKDAPEDTQYFLYYRYGSWTEECQEYSKDTLQRNIACWFPRTFINSKGRDSLAVYVNGSSEEAVIKPFDELFALHAIDRVNPPAKVTAEIEGTCLSIQWEKPVSAFPVHCFDYEVKIYNTRKGYFQIEKMTTNTFISVIDGISEYSIQVRAAVSSVCRAVGPSSEWSQPIYVGPGPNLTKQTHRMQAPLPHRFICTDEIHSMPREGDQQKKRESVSGNFQQGYEFLQTPATEA